MRRSEFNLQEICRMYTHSIFAVSGVARSGDCRIGSAFHVGGGFCVTARHVWEGMREHRVSTDQDLEWERGGWSKFEGPWYHPDETIDVAIFRILAFDDGPLKFLREIPLTAFFDRWIPDFWLEEVVVLGFPPIPLSSRAHLVAVKGEINAVITPLPRAGRRQHAHFILSHSARGGFSGGPCLVARGIYGSTLGVVTEALKVDSRPDEQEFATVQSAEPIYATIAHHDLAVPHLPTNWRALLDRSARRWADSERGQRIRTAREQAGLSRRELAERAFGSWKQEPTLCGIEDGVFEATADEKQKIAVVLGHEVSVLWATYEDENL